MNRKQFIAGGAALGLGFAIKKSHVNAEGVTIIDECRLYEVSIVRPRLSLAKLDAWLEEFKDVPDLSLWMSHKARSMLWENLQTMVRYQADQSGPHVGRPTYQGIPIYEVGDIYNDGAGSIMLYTGLSSDRGKFIDRKHVMRELLQEGMGYIDAIERID